MALNFKVSFEDVVAGLELMEDWSPFVEEDFRTACKILIYKSFHRMEEEEIGAKFSGLRGWHKYLIRNNGTVCFSAFHAFPEATEKAKEIGFEICQ